MKKNQSISQKALEVINRQGIRPIPAWEFVAKYWLLWLGLGLTVLLLVLAFSVSWFGLAGDIITPYFWLLLTFSLLVLSYFLFIHTKKAYRVQKWQVIILITLLGLTAGGLLHKIGLAGQLDRRLESNLSFYRHLVPMKMSVWTNPASGYLSGEIIDLTDSSNFLLRDFNRRVWAISGRAPLIRGRVQMVVGQQIKLIGTQTGPTTFEVEEIRPWNGMGKN